MSLSRLIILFSLLITLSGCNSAGVKNPMPEEMPQTEKSEQTASNKPEKGAPQQTQVADPASQSTTQVDQIANRLTVVQDHLLQLKSIAAELQQQNKTLSFQFQALKTELQALAEESQLSVPEAEPTPTADAFNDVLDQITMMANELGTQVQDGAFRMASAYTAKGQWVLVRYHRYTGEAWLADKGQWNLLEESGATGTADYEVVVLRADKDIKGYVASRVNRISGDSWWLKQNTWQPYVSK